MFVLVSSLFSILSREVSLPCANINEFMHQFNQPGKTKLVLIRFELVLNIVLPCQ